MRGYGAKESLYHKIAALRQRIGIDETLYPINMVDICAHLPDVSIGFYPFVTPGLRGVAALADTASQNNVIILNQTHNAREQNFSCGHEMVHISEHQNAQIKTFNCFDCVREKQNGFLEWQANEGAAELLVPHNLMLPIIREYHNGLDDGAVISRLKKVLCEEFRVSSAVIHYRLESLKFEIEQYVKDIPMDNIRILSRSQQELAHIRIKSLNTIEEEQQKYPGTPVSKAPPLSKVHPLSRQTDWIPPLEGPEFLKAEAAWLYDIK